MKVTVRMKGGGGGGKAGGRKGLVGVRGEGQPTTCQDTSLVLREVDAPFALSNTKRRVYWSRTTCNETQ